MKTILAEISALGAMLPGNPIAALAYPGPAQLSMKRQAHASGKGGQIEVRSRQNEIELHPRWMDILPWIGPIDFYLQIGPVGLSLQIGQAHLSLRIDLIDPFLCPGARTSHAFAAIVRD